MISLTERQVSILGELKSTEGFLTVKHLSEAFHVSERTIRYDLDFISSFLEELDVQLVRKQSMGIRLQLHPRQKQTIDGALHQLNALILTSQNLIYALAIRILMDRETTLDRLGEIYGTSKSRIFHCMSAIEDLFKKFGLTLERKRSKGISLSGNEIDCRYAFMQLINELMENSQVDKKYFIPLFSESCASRARSLIEQFESEMQVRFSDGAHWDLLLTLCFQFHQLVKKHLVSYPFIEIKDALKTPEFQVIKKSMNQLTDSDIPQDEVAFSLRQFKVSKLTAAPVGKAALIEDGEAYSISLFFAEEAGRSIGIDFTKDDELIHGLTYHLQVSLNRIRHHLPIQNTLTEQIKYKFRFIYEITRKIVIKLEKSLGIAFPEEEIAFLAMHLGACYERHSATGFMPSALIVCGSGLATSSLLASRLKVMMPEIKSVGPVNVSQLQTLDVSEIDFIISTVPIDFPKRQVIVVNPLLESDDLNRLQKLLFKRTYEKQMNDLMQINQPRTALGSLIPEEFIQLNQPIRDWRESIREASRPLLVNENIAQRYIDAMIKAVEELGPYMVFIPSVAIVHASYKDGVRKDGLSLLTLKEPIPFGDKTDVQAKIIFVMCSTQANSDHFIKLVKILDNPENLAVLKKATQLSDVLHLNN